MVIIIKRIIMLALCMLAIMAVQAQTQKKCK